MSKERVTCISVVKKFASAHTKGEFYANAQGVDYAFIEANTRPRRDGIHHHYRSHRDFLSGDGQTIWQCAANAIGTYEGHYRQRNQVEETTSMSIL